MKNKEWFADWFDSKYYHILYQHRDEKEAEYFIKKVLQYFDMKNCADVLDLACGKGRHAIMLHQMGMNVTGVDLAPESIKTAKQDAPNELKFDVHDMRKTYKENAYDYVLNLFTSFGYFDNSGDNLKVLKGIENSLKQQGYILIDFMNAKEAIKNLIPEEEKEVQGIKFYIQREYDGQFIKKNIRFVAENKEYEYTERVQALLIDDFKDLFDQTNLEIMDTFGNYDLDNFQEDTSDRLIITAKK